MQTQSRFNIGFFFISIGVLVSLITTVVSFLNLFFSTLNRKFPDVLNSTYQYGFNSYDYEGIRMALSTLIIFFPVFIIVSYFWKKLFKMGVGSIDEVIRKWMIYLILFLSSLVVIVDLVTLVRYFISGEVTNRFIFKVLAVLLVAAFVGVHYIFELKGRTKFMGMPVGWVSAVKATVWVLLVISFSFYVMGSPASQRKYRLDDRRISDLQNIQYQVINFWQQKGKLPKELTELANPISGYSLPVPPEFEKGEKYEYKSTAWLKFELCATFSAPMQKGWHEYDGGGVYPMSMRDMAVSTYPYPGGGVNESWDHEEGRTCFARTIDRDIYPPFPKPVAY